MVAWGGGGMDGRDGVGIIYDLFFTLSLSDSKLLLSFLGFWDFFDDQLILTSKF